MHSSQMLSPQCCDGWGESRRIFSINRMELLSTFLKALNFPPDTRMGRETANRCMPVELSENQAVFKIWKNIEVFISDHSLHLMGE